MPRADHEVLTVAQDRLNQAFIIVEVVFQVGILEQDHIPGCDLQPVSYRVSLAAWPVFQNQPHARMVAVRERQFAAAVVELLSTRMISISMLGICFSTNISISSGNVERSL